MTGRMRGNDEQCNEVGKTGRKGRERKWRAGDGKREWGEEGRGDEGEEEEEADKGEGKGNLERICTCNVESVIESKTPTCWCSTAK